MDLVSKKNVELSIERIRTESPILKELEDRLERGMHTKRDIEVLKRKNEASIQEAIRTSECLICVKVLEKLLQKYYYLLV